MPTVNGVDIKSRLAELIMRRDLLANQFSQNVKVFLSQKYKAIEGIDSDLIQAEITIARLQAVQAVYNTMTLVECRVMSDKPLALDVLINVVGAYGRATARWTDNARGGAADKYRYRSDTRTAGEEQMEYQLEPDVAMHTMLSYKRNLNTIRAAIMTGNMTSFEIDAEVFHQLFED